MAQRILEMAPAQRHSLTTPRSGCGLIRNIYVADTYNNRIRKITPAGVVSTFAGSTEGSADAIGTAARFKLPYGVAVDSSGNVYVGDNGNHRIRKIEYKLPWASGAMAPHVNAVPFRTAP